MRAIAPVPSDGRVRVGARLRAARQAQGLTIEHVASATGLTRGFISRVERDETSPSVASLVAICQVLSLPVGSLFEVSEVDVVPLHAAPLINMGGHGVTERLVTPRGQSRVQVLHSTLEPGADGGAELYTVNCDIEVLHVISGELTLRFPERELVLTTGDTITFPGQEPHTWRNTGPQTAMILWVIVPAAWSGAS